MFSPLAPQLALIETVADFFCLQVSTTLVAGNMIPAWILMWYTSNVRYIRGQSSTGMSYAVFGLR